MILHINELIGHLQSIAKSSDPAKPSDALWIRFSAERSQETVEYRTADENQIVHVYLNKSGAIVGIEIFP
jgi:uncharacterized protein YuzE